MERFLGKCKGEEVEEIAVLGMRTRARAASAMAETTTSSPAKKIKKVPTTTRTTASYDVPELKRRRRATVTPENSVSCWPETTTTIVEEEDVVAAANRSKFGEVCSDFTGSCCSSFEALSSCELVKDRSETIADPEIKSAEPSPRCFESHRTTRREKNSGIAISDDQDSPPRRPNAKPTVQIKMSSDNSEIEEFFSAAEKDLQKRFAEKYNFDIVKDVPLEGRYEWVQIKP